MRCVRTEIEADVIKYELDKGLEDGFQLWSEVVTQGAIVTDRLITVTKPDGRVMCPYIINRRGQTFIAEGDYIILEDDGTKHVCGEDKIFNRYRQI